MIYGTGRTGNSTGEGLRQSSAKHQISLYTDKSFATTKETAEIIAFHQKCKVIVNPDLIERDYGILSGLTPQERNDFVRQGRPDGVEPWEVLAKRAFQAIENLACSCPGKIAVVSHGAWINALLAVISGHKIGSGKTALKNACISMLYQEKNEWKIGFYNLIGEEIKKEISARI